MKKLRLYLDTTVWNYSFADDTPDHRDETLEFFGKVRLDLFEIFISETVLRELKDAPPKRNEQVTGLLKDTSPQFLDAKPEIEKLAAMYLEKGVLTKKSDADALHIAYATVNEMDYLLSWNFHHLANPNRREKVRVVNLSEGYRYPLIIGTPLEMLDAE